MTGTTISINVKCFESVLIRVGEGWLTVRTLSFHSGWRYRRACKSHGCTFCPWICSCQQPYAQPSSQFCASNLSVKPSYFKRMKKWLIGFWSKEFDSEIYSWRELSRWLSLTPLIENFSTIKSGSKTLDTLKGVLADKIMLREWEFLTVLNCCITNYPKP